MNKQRAHKSIPQNFLWTIMNINILKVTYKIQENMCISTSLVPCIWKLIFKMEWGDYLHPDLHKDRYEHAENPCCQPELGGSQDLACSFQHEHMSSVNQQAQPKADKITSQKRLKTTNQLPEPYSIIYPTLEAFLPLKYGQSVSSCVDAFESLYVKITCQKLKLLILKSMLWIDPTP